MRLHGIAAMHCGRFSSLVGSPGFGWAVCFFFSFVVISGCTTFEREKGVKMSNHGPDTGKNGKKS